MIDSLALSLKAIYMKKKDKDFYKIFPEYKMFDNGIYWEEKAKKIRNDFYYTQFIDSLFWALKFGLGVALSYIIFYAVFSAHIITLAESVCPLIVK